MYEGRITGYFILACVVGSLGGSLFGYDLGVSKFGSFEVVQGETDFGPTVVDSDIKVIEEKNFDDINVALKQFSEGLDKSLISEVESCEPDFGPTVVDSDIQVIEAKSLDDINVALRQFSEGLDKPLSLEVASSEVIERERHFFEAMATDSDIQVIEAKSLDGEAVALKQFSEGPDKSSIPDIGSSQLIPDVPGIEPTETNSDIPRQAPRPKFKELIEARRTLQIRRRGQVTRFLRLAAIFTNALARGSSGGCRAIADIVGQCMVASTTLN